MVAGTARGRRKRPTGTYGWLIKVARLAPRNREREPVLLALDVSINVEEKMYINILEFSFPNNDKQNKK